MKMYIGWTDNLGIDDRFGFKIERITSYIEIGTCSRSRRDG